MTDWSASPKSVSTCHDSTPWPDPSRRPLPNLLIMIEVGKFLPVFWVYVAWAKANWLVGIPLFLSLLTSALFGGRMDRAWYKALRKPLYHSVSYGQFSFKFCIGWLPRIGSFQSSGRFYTSWLATLSSSSLAVSGRWLSWTSSVHSSLSSP